MQSVCFFPAWTECWRAPVSSPTSCSWTMGLPCGRRLIGTQSHGAPWAASRCWRCDGMSGTSGRSPSRWRSSNNTSRPSARCHGRRRRRRARGRTAPARVPRSEPREQGGVRGAHADDPKAVMFRVFYALYRWAHVLLTGIPVRVGNFSVIPSSQLRRLVVVSELWNHYAAAVFKARVPRTSVPTVRAPRLDGQVADEFRRSRHAWAVGTIGALRAHRRQAARRDGGAGRCDGVRAAGRARDPVLHAPGYPGVDVHCRRSSVGPDAPGCRVCIILRLSRAPRPLAANLYPAPRLRLLRRPLFDGRRV